MVARASSISPTSCTGRDDTAARSRPVLAGVPGPRPGDAGLARRTGFRTGVPVRATEGDALTARLPRPASPHPGGGGVRDGNSTPPHRRTKNMQTLSFDDDLPSPTVPTARTHGCRRSARKSPAASSRAASPCRTSDVEQAGHRIGSTARVRARGQARHQRLGRRQPARAVQVPLGVGQVSRPAAPTTGCRKRSTCSATSSCGRTRTGSTDDERLIVKRNLGFFVTADQPRRQQHRARHLSPHHRARVPPVPAAPGVRGGDPHARLPVHRREPGPRRSRDLQRATTRSSRSSDKDDFLIPFIDALTDPMFKTGTPEADQELLKSLIVFRLHHGGAVLLRRLRADPRRWAARTR